MNEIQSTCINGTLDLQMLVDSKLAAKICVTTCSLKGKLQLRLGGRRHRTECLSRGIVAMYPRGSNPPPPESARDRGLLPNWQKYEPVASQRRSRSRKDGGRHLDYKPFNMPWECSRGLPVPSMPTFPFVAQTFES